jgi:hypothetical protein
MSCFFWACLNKNKNERNSKQLNFILNQINVIIYSYQHSMKKYVSNFFFAKWWMRREIF